MILNKIKSSSLTALFVSAMVVSGGSYAAGHASDGHIGIDISLSNKTGKLGVYTFREQAKDLTTLGAEFLFNEDNDNFVEVFGSIVRKGMVDENLEFGFKGKLFHVSQNHNNQDGYGLLLGVTGRYWFPTEIPTAIAVDLLYNPPIVAFGNVERAVDFEVRAELRILPTAVAYIGFRKLTVDFDRRSNYNIDDGIHLGINVAIQ